MTQREIERILIKAHREQGKMLSWPKHKRTRQEKMAIAALFVIGLCLVLGIIFTLAEAM